MSMLSFEIFPQETYVQKFDAKPEEELEYADSIVVYSNEQALPLQIEEYSDFLPITVHYKGMTITGIFKSQDNEHITMVTEDGTEVRTKYNNVAFPSKFYHTKVRVADTKSRLELCYRTSQVKWTSELYISSTLSEANSCNTSSWGKLTLMADVISDYKTPVTADITLVAQNTSRPSPGPRSSSTRSSAPMMSFQSSSYESASSPSNSEEQKSDINYRIGVQTLNKRQKWNLSSQEIPLDLVQYVPINSWGRNYGKQDGYAERSIIFYAPSYLIQSIANLHITTEKGVLHNTVSTRSYQKDELVRLQLGGSTFVSYVNEYTTKEHKDRDDNTSIITTGVIIIKSKSNTCVLVGLARGGNLKVISPEPNMKLSTPSIWYWTLEIDSVKETRFNYSYRLD